ncbi:leucine-rich repeat protein [Ruminococcus flavefaciens]|nr:leucine-rich repeat protein [Ruminococcus flavefaciens]
MKKIVSTFLAAAICMTSAPVMTSFTATADSSTDEMIARLEENDKHGYCGEDARWDIEGSTLYISGYGKVNTNGNAPWNNYSGQIFRIIIGKDITEIGNSAFKDTKAQYITIENGVRVIGENAFENCSELRNISFPDSVEKISKDALKGCAALEYIQVSNPDCDIDQSKDTLYNGKTGTIYSPDSQKSTPYTVLILGLSQSTAHAYAAKYSLRFNDYLISSQDIGESSFKYKKGVCGETTFWNISDNGTLSITGDGDTVAWLRSDYVPWHEFRPEITSLEVAEGITKLGTAAMTGCSNLQSISLPGTLNLIGASVFQKCSKIKEADIPESVTTLGRDAFKDCANLRTIIIRNPDCKIVGGKDTICNGQRDYSGYFNGTIYGYKGSTAETYAEESGYKFVDIEDSPYKGANLNKQINAVPAVIRKGADGSQVIECGDIIFGACHKEGEYYNSPTFFLFDDTVIISDLNSMKDWSSAGQSPFNLYKDRIEKVIVQCDSVGSYSFAGFTNLKSVIFTRNSLSEGIGESAFEGCASLESVVLPSLIHGGIKANAFKNCTSLKQITFKRSDTQILGDGATISNKTVDGKPVFTGTIYGKAESTAQAYAEKYGYNFADYDNIPYTTAPASTTTTTTKATTTTTKAVTTTTKATTTTTKATTTTTKAATTTTKATTTTTKAATTTTKASTTTTKATSTTTKATTTTTKATSTTTTASTTVTTTVDTYTSKGDLNHDGNVNVGDLVYLQRVLLGIEKSPEYSCDFNGDGVNDIFDMIALRKLLVRIMNSSN